MNFCTKCGQKLIEKANFCPSCGEKILKSKIEKEPQKPTENKSVSNQITILEASDIEKINKKIELQNNQSGTVKKAWYAAVFFALIIIVAFIDFDALPIHPSIAMISLFFLILSIIIALMFRSREKKLQSLITGENLLASWTLNDTEKDAYVNYLFKHERGKNMAILIVISAISIVVFGVFILIIDEGKLAMFLVLIGLLVFLSFFAFGMPRYYKYQNSKNDGQILLGAKYAYINGYFHNWDFVLSGIKKARIIDQPFYGLYIKYYYTDRTFTNTEELNIPAPKQVDLNIVLAALNN